MSPRKACQWVSCKPYPKKLGEGRSLLVLCSAWRGASAAKAVERWPNLTLKKIPKVVLLRCEWGRDDYSLNVAQLTAAEVSNAPSTGEADRSKQVDRARQKTKVRRSAAPKKNARIDEVIYDETR